MTESALGTGIVAALLFLITTNTQPNLTKIAISNVRSAQPALASSLPRHVGEWTTDDGAALIILNFGMLQFFIVAWGISGDQVRPCHREVRRLLDTVGLP